MKRFKRVREKEVFSLSVSAFFFVIIVAAQYFYFVMLPSNHMHTQRTRQASTIENIDS